MCGCFERSHALSLVESLEYACHVFTAHAVASRSLPRPRSTFVYAHRPWSQRARKGKELRMIKTSLTCGCGRGPTTRNLGCSFGMLPLVPQPINSAAGTDSVDWLSLSLSPAYSLVHPYPRGPRARCVFCAHRHRLLPAVSCGRKTAAVALSASAGRQPNIPRRSLPPWMGSL